MIFNYKIVPNPKVSHVLVVSHDYINLQVAVYVPTTSAVVKEFFCCWTYCQ